MGKNIGALAGRRRRNTQLLVGGALAVVVLSVLALVATQRWWVADASGAAPATRPAPPPVVATPAVAPLRPDALVPTPAGVAAVLGPRLGNPGLGSFTGSVTDAATGAVLWSAQPDRPMTPASTVKILTATAALLALPSDHRVATNVVQGATPTELVLVAGGDPTLTAQPVGKPNYYPGAARVDDLVDQIKRTGVRYDALKVDLGAYIGPTMAPGWIGADIAGGYIAPTEPIMIDGGRLRPLEHESPRSATPAMDAARLIAAGLGIDPARVTLGTASPGAAPVAGVQSAPLRERLRQMMEHSDNVLAEAVAREIARKIGVEPSFSGGTTAITETLRKAGIDLGGLLLRDASGLSTDDRLPARLLDKVMALAAGNGNPALRPLLDFLPVAGATGTLSDRYATGDRSGAGWVRAKTGTLSTASSLVGYVVDASGRALTFALMSNDRPPEVARPALDAVASALRSCGCT